MHTARIPPVDPAPATITAVLAMHAGHICPSSELLIRSRRLARTGILHQRPRRRGDGTTWSYLDITPLGRQETWEDSPEGCPQTPPYKWWNWHDNYDSGASPDPKWVEVSDAGEPAFRKRDAEAKAS